MKNQIVSFLKKTFGKNPFQKTVVVSDVFEFGGNYCLILFVPEKEFISRHMATRMLFDFLEQKYESVYTFNDVYEYIHQLNKEKGNILDKAKEEYQNWIEKIEQLNGVDELLKLSQGYQIFDICKKFPHKKRITYLLDAPKDTFSTDYHSLSYSFERDFLNHEGKYNGYKMAESMFRVVKNRGDFSKSINKPYEKIFFQCLDEFYSRFSVTPEANCHSVLIRLVSPEDEMQEIKLLLMEFKAFFDDEYYKIKRDQVESDLIKKELVRKELERKEKIIQMTKGLSV